MNFSYLFSMNLQKVWEKINKSMEDEHEHHKEEDNDDEYIDG